MSALERIDKPAHAREQIERERSYGGDSNRNEEIMSHNDRAQGMTKSNARVSRTAKMVGDKGRSITTVPFPYGRIFPCGRTSRITTKRQ